ncbi:DinB family protein [Hymenobacter jeollabukensis]|uniref:DinB family protein n=1 Tax=Hymenobacter jeollabukensis TaxID=2025313 RepID=A0A5R8WN91_9BACT|nr:DinB family protein [Hymenobacter jeollabukensis]TLM91040.1 DinB family protein [Hymenobacter jeollabukensis]
MDKHTREQLVKELTALLEQGQAHVTFEAATADVPAALLNQRPDGLPYSLWELAEHVRLAQWDILEFSRDARHRSPEWPAGYWPAQDEPADAARWQATLRQIKDDRAQFLALLQDPGRDLLAPLPHGTGQTLLREALLIADHNAYHTGQIILVRRRLGNWD